MMLVGDVSLQLQQWLIKVGLPTIVKTITWFYAMNKNDRVWVENVIVIESKGCSGWKRNANIVTFVSDSIQSEPDHFLKSILHQILQKIRWNETIFSYFSSFVLSIFTNCKWLCFVVAHPTWKMNSFMIMTHSK